MKPRTADGKQIGFREQKMSEDNNQDEWTEPVRLF